MGGRSYSRCFSGDCHNLDNGKCSVDPLYCPVERHRRERQREEKSDLAVKSKKKRVIK